MMVKIVESDLRREDAVFSFVHAPGEPWMHEITVGQIIRIIDIEGNQAVDTLFFNARNLDERYSFTETITAQGNAYLGTGTCIMSSEGRPMLTIIADTCGRHDTIGGSCCSQEGNSVRYGLDKRFMHACRDNFMLGVGHWGRGMNKRDIVSNINFFMNVPVRDTTLHFEDGISGPGKYVELRAEMDILILISNCPQLNNPANGYNPTPIEYLVWDRSPISGQ
jgi:urea carboxylase-associated protein 1